MSQHHPSEDLLLEFAAGVVPPHIALCINVHLQFCNQCRAQLESMDELGGLMIHSLDDEPVNDSQFNDILKEIDRGEVSELPTYSMQENPPSKPALTAYLPTGLKNVTWRRQWWKVYEHILDAPERVQWHLALQKISAGGRAPYHTHDGREITVVLQGGFSDELGVYESGDFVIRDGSHSHRPRALENEDCICLTLMEGGVHLAGPFGRWFDKFISLFADRHAIA